MELEFSVHGRSCDLALHPISKKTAETVRTNGRKVYKEKALKWWRNGSTTTWGMKIDEECHMQIMLNNDPISIAPCVVTATALTMQRRRFLDSKAKYLCLFGYDNEVCKFSWVWEGVQNFDIGKFEFMVHNWDRLMGVPNYNILDEIRYDGQFADRHDWCDASGFSLIEPKLIDLDQARRDWAGFENRIKLEFPFDAEHEPPAHSDRV